MLESKSERSSIPERSVKMKRRTKRQLKTILKSSQINTLESYDCTWDLVGQSEAVGYNSYYEWIDRVDSCSAYLATDRELLCNSSSEIRLS